MIYLLCAAALWLAVEVGYRIGIWVGKEGGYREGYAAGIRPELARLAREERAEQARQADLGVL